MGQRDNAPAQEEFLGTFLASNGYALCHVLDWGYTSDDFEYDEDNEQQLVLPADYRYGALRAGIAVEIQLPENGEIPVYVERVGATQGRIVVAIDSWVTEGHELNAVPSVTGREMIADDMGRLSRRETLGYVSASGNGILVTEIDFLDACRRYSSARTGQITIPPDNDEQDPLHIGVLVGLTPQRPEQEFPVFGEYEEDRLARIVVELADVTWHDE